MSNGCRRLSLPNSQGPRGATGSMWGLSGPAGGPVGGPLGHSSLCPALHCVPAPRSGLWGGGAGEAPRDLSRYQSGRNSPPT